MKTKQVKLETETITISKMPLIKYAEVVAHIQSLPSHLSELGDIDKKNITEIIAPLIQKGLPDLIKILSVATPLSKSEIENLGLDELIDVVEAVVEVNNYIEVWAKAKKLLAQRQQAQENPVQKTG
jgi:hypothetical protein